MSVRNVTQSRIADAIRQASGNSYVSRELKTGIKYPENRGQTDVTFRDGNKWMSVTMNDRDVPPAYKYTMTESSLPGSSLVD